MTGGAEGQTPTSYAVTFRVAVPTLKRPASAYKDGDGMALAISAIIALEEQSAAEYVRRLLSTGEETLLVDVAPVYDEVITTTQTSSRAARPGRRVSVAAVLA